MENLTRGNSWITGTLIGLFVISIFFLLIMNFGLFPELKVKIVPSSLLDDDEYNELLKNLDNQIQEAKQQSEQEAIIVKLEKEREDLIRSKESEIERIKEGDVAYYSGQVAEKVEWVLDRTIWPLLGGDVTWGGKFLNFLKFLILGFLSAFTALWILGALMLGLGAIEDNFILESIFEQSILGQGWKLWLSWWKVIYSSGVFAIVYAILMIIPVINRIVELVSFQLLWNIVGLLYTGTEWILRWISLTIFLVLIFFVPAMAKWYVRKKKLQKKEDALQDYIAGVAASVAAVKQAGKS